MSIRCDPNRCICSMQLLYICRCVSDWYMRRHAFLATTCRQGTFTTSLTSVSSAELPVDCAKLASAETTASQLNAWAVLVIQRQWLALFESADSISNCVAPISVRLSLHRRAASRSVIRAPRVFVRGCGPTRLAITWRCDSYVFIVVVGSRFGSCAMANVVAQLSAAEKASSHGGLTCLHHQAALSKQSSVAGCYCSCLFKLCSVLLVA